MNWVDPRIWAPGEPATAAKFNEISAALGAVGDQWQAYTPTIVASTTDPTLGASALAGRYRIAGKTADVHVSLTISAGWSGGSGFYRFSLPDGMVPILTTTGEAMGYASIRDASTGDYYQYTAYRYSTTRFALTGSAGGLSNTSPVTWASGDLISVHIPALEIA